MSKGSQTSFAITKIILSNKVDIQGKKTNVKMTYIDTYDSIDGSISFSFGESGFAAGVEFSKTEKNWQIKIDVSDICY